MNRRSTSLPALVLAGMISLLTLLSASLMTPSTAHADARSAGCGMGYMIFLGQQGLSPQLLAATTNAIYSNQMFGISSGTLSCQADGIVFNEQARHLYVQANRPQLLHDIAQGEGEYLEALADSMGIVQSDRSSFRSHTRAQLAILATSPDTDQFLTQLDASLKAHPLLARYSAATVEVQ